ncbi:MULTISPECIES: hypothetical protein [unclassified Bradyrhizobium]|uniref:hypothetical protein n=1 Tax=unclassified Bradyrhizobium TaxID=2631580 RepID=UPI0028EBC6C0|nr:MULTISPECIES: hypothetical protein [unclassified Bradyrhizobium]
MTQQHCTRAFAHPTTTAPYEGECGLIKISRSGANRSPVVIVGPWAFKFARNKYGRRCNQFEADLYASCTEQQRRSLCTAVWVSSGGLLLVMAAAKPLTSPLSLSQLNELYRDWAECPFEPGARNWGIYKGRHVAIDYSATVLEE